MKRMLGFSAAARKLVAAVRDKNSAFIGWESCRAATYGPECYAQYGIGEQLLQIRKQFEESSPTRLPEASCPEVLS
jgi:hypothetical protein